MSENSSFPATAAAQPPAAHEPFRLSRYFSAVSVVGIGIVIAVMFALSNQAMKDTLIRQESDQNLALGRTMLNSLWPQYVSLAARAHKLSPADLVDQIENVQLRQEIYRLTHKLNVVKIRIYSTRGQILFSNWDTEIGRIQNNDKAIDRALGGSNDSELAFAPKFEAIDGTVRDRHIVTTFMPIDHPQTGERQGVLEMYTDVSGELAAARGEQIRIAGVLAFCMFALYVFLMLAVRRAEKIMSEQQRALAESERRARMFERVVGQSRDSIITRDLNGVIMTWNTGAETIFGYSAEEAIGRSMRALTLKEISEDEWQTWLTRLRSGNTFTIRGWRPAKGGKRVHIVGTSGPLTDENGRLIGDIAVAHDTTWLERTQMELRRAKDEAEAAARAKSEFLANMSHEIRTPMNGIIGMTNLALDTPLNAEQRDYLATVKSSADALLQIINDILDLSKIEAGKLGIEAIKFSLRESLQQTIRVLAVRAHEKRLELLWSVDARVPDALIGDPLRLRQILLNLVGNAIKFTAEGEVEIQVTLDDAREREVQLRFRVRDTGIGIPTDKLGSIFEAFEQADSSTTRQFGGTGLGLSICRRLVHLMRGSIEVASSRGGGSVFQFSLCLGLQQAPQYTPSIAAETPAGALFDQPVLVVDDNARCRQLLCAYLESWGMTPTACDSVAGALAHLATARAAGRAYRLALIDANLPDGDAFKLAAETASADTAVLMLADTTQGPALAEARKHKRVHALFKPVSQSCLYDGVAVVLDPALTDMPAPAAESQGVAPSHRMARALDVLLVEDNAVNRKLATRLLERMGHRVTEVHDGAAALTATADRDFDVVLMDMQMPVMDGLEATRAIRAREGGERHTPIIALTANAMSGDRERCLEAGMDDYVSKPIDADALVAALLRVAAGTNAVATTEHAADGAIDPMPAIQPVYSHTEALERAGGDAELLAQIIDIFLEETPALVAQLGDFLAHGNHENAFRSAHTIKGSSANLSAAALVGAARAVELAARAGELDAARAAYPALRTAAAQLFSTLAAERAIKHEAALCGVPS